MPETEGQRAFPGLEKKGETPVEKRMEFETNVTRLDKDRNLRKARSIAKDWKPDEIQSSSIEIPKYTPVIVQGVRGVLMTALGAGDVKDFEFRKDEKGNPIFSKRDGFTFIEAELRTQTLPIYPMLPAAFKEWTRTRRTKEVLSGTAQFDLPTERIQILHPERVEGEPVRPFNISVHNRFLVRKAPTPAPST